MAWPYLPVNPECSASPCNPTPSTSDLLTYAGPNLPCTGINSCDTLSVSLQKIDEIICELQTTPTTTSTTTSIPIVVTPTLQQVFDAELTTTLTAKFSGAYPLSTIDFQLDSEGVGFINLSISNTLNNNSFTDVYVDSYYGGVFHRNGNISSRRSEFYVEDDQVIQAVVINNFSTTTNFLPPTANTILQFPAKAAGTYTIATLDDIPTTTSTTTVIPEGIINNIYKIVVNLTSPQLLDLYTTPLNIIPSPGIGKAIVILNAVARFNFVSDTYDNTTLYIKTVGAVQSQYYSGNNFTNATVTNISTFLREVGTGTILENSPIFLTTGYLLGVGDCTVNLYITYEILTL